MTLISILTYQVHVMDPMLFCIDTGAPISCIGGKVLKRIIYSVGRKSILMIKSDIDFQFVNAVIKSEGMVKLLLRTPGNIQDESILLYVVDVNIHALLGLFVLDGNNLFVNSVAGHF